MKVCVTCVRSYPKPIEFKIVDQLVDEMIRTGMPQEMATELIEKGRAVWTLDKIDHKVIFAAEIIEKEKEL